MTLSKGLPGRHPLARIGVIGNPYHGLVQGGSMTLPNATVKAYPQPDASWPDQAGAAHLLRRPGIPAVSRTPAQAADDTARGWQWRNVAMLSGGRQQLYGRDLGGWVYIAPDGSRWLLQFATDLESTSFNFGAPLSLLLNVSRFGDFNADGWASTVTLTLTDWGQQGYPALRDFPTGGTPTNVTAANLVLDAVTPTGSRAALCVHRRRLTSDVAYDPTVDVAVRHALGWLEVSVSMVGGLPVPVLSVLKTRAQTLVIQEREVVNSPITVSLPPLIDPGVTTEARVGEFTFAYETVRLVAAWVNHATDEWRWVSLRYRHAGQNICSVSGSGLRYTARSEISFINWVALELDGVEQQRIEGSIESTSEETATYFESTGGFGAVELQQQAIASTLVLDGVEYSQTTAAEPPEIVDEETTATIDVQGNPGGFYVGPDSEFTWRIFQMQWREQLRAILSPPYPYQVAVDVCHQSPQVLGLRMHVLSESIDQFTYWPMITPAGPIGSKTTRPYLAAERLYGAWCPHTGQVVTMRDAPLCWV